MFDPRLRCFVFFSGIRGVQVVDHLLLLLLLLLLIICCGATCSQLDPNLIPSYLWKPTKMVWSDACKWPIWSHSYRWLSYASLRVTPVAPIYLWQIMREAFDLIVDALVHQHLQSQGMWQISEVPWSTEKSAPKAVGKKKKNQLSLKYVLEISKMKQIYPKNEKKHQLHQTPKTKWPTCCLLTARWRPRRWTWSCWWHSWNSSGCRHHSSWPRLSQRSPWERSQKDAVTETGSRNWCWTGSQVDQCCFRPPNFNKNRLTHHVSPKKMGKKKRSAQRPDRREIPRRSPRRATYRPPDRRHVIYIVVKNVRLRAVRLTESFCWL